MISDNTSILKADLAVGFPYRFDSRNNMIDHTKSKTKDLKKIIGLAPNPPPPQYIQFV